MDPKEAAGMLTRIVIGLYTWLVRRERYPAVGRSNSPRRRSSVEVMAGIANALLVPMQDSVR